MVTQLEIMIAMRVLENVNHEDMREEAVASKQGAKFKRKEWLE